MKRKILTFLIGISFVISGLTECKENINQNNTEANAVSENLSNSESEEKLNSEKPEFDEKLLEITDEFKLVDGKEEDIN